MAPSSSFARVRRGSPSWTLFAVRYGLGAVLVVAGVVLLVLDPGGFGVDGFAMAAGSGLSVLMLNWLYRLGVHSDQDRVREEEARTFLAEHGHWPDEAPRPTASRRGARRGPPASRT
jgi:hypothetical protein